jgi:secretion/DNA translocation related CpaE-like protein
MSDERPVAMVGDESVLDDLLRLAAAAGCALERVPDLAALRATWQAAPLVVLDSEAAAALAGSSMPRRHGVLMVCGEQPESSEWEHALAVGAEQVLTLPADDEQVVSAFADATSIPAPESGRVIAVAGGRGGGGASLLAGAVGLAALRGGRNALLVDLDSLGGGIDLLLGAEQEDGLRWPDVRLSGGRVDMAALRTALPGRSHGGARLSVLSCGRAGDEPDPAATAAVVESGRRAGEVVVCDLPRAWTETGCVALERADLTVLVVPAEVRACAAARTVARRMRACGADPVVVVRGPAPGALRADEVAAAVDVPLFAAMRPEPSVEVALERGALRARSRGPLAAAAAALLDEVEVCDERVAA